MLLVVRPNNAPSSDCPISPRVWRWLTAWLPLMSKPRQVEAACRYRSPARITSRRAATACTWTDSSVDPFSPNPILSSLDCHLR
jgi:hypothetical protein